MPIGFNLFSFDFFEAFRRGQQDASTVDPDHRAPAKSVADEQADDEDAHRRAADQAFWGLGCFPVL